MHSAALVMSNLHMTVLIPFELWMTIGVIP